MAGVPQCSRCGGGTTWPTSATPRTNATRGSAGLGTSGTKDDLSGAPGWTRPTEHQTAGRHEEGSRPTAVPLIRLIAQPLPPDKVEAARQKLRQRASRKQEKLDPRTLIAAGFMVLVTSLPEHIPTMEILGAYRLRWQIELAFKRLKSLLNIDRIPTRTTAGGLSWLYPHLILALLTEDICQDFLEASP